ncbi:MULTISPECIES: hypothetical protein [unclassified Streptomyces]|uniref:Uncharacterized protein n=1 Tax=Streptomyces evansiae TaxID=3075535 RepID=A0ABU2QXJ6_9ACTN|nr:MULTISPECIES: hypothetical protein [unclassified Streptomyces]MDT0409168.1 hypothetical protein [Streptomyces sp. DSM 41979]MYQ58546.1 hypothetical protein [Streptomyces sp. SID4926]MYR27902.1 hypothetical protein [Streptomyces sp. SID4945]SCD89972.1 hypothetical protein GA0115251_128129 [Streptomyces sp. TverLS-915]SCE25046.1 hypothetical protein GA0115252_13773 [Streptomyces sp. DfronAA-171]
MPTTAPTTEAPRTPPAAVPSMRALLESCAAATAVSTPPAPAARESEKDARDEGRAQARKG